MHLWGIDHSDSLSGGGRVAAVWVKASRCGGPRAGGREGWGAGHRVLGLYMFQGDVGGQGRGLNIGKLFLFVPLTVEERGQQQSSYRVGTAGRLPLSTTLHRLQTSLEGRMPALPLSGDLGVSQSPLGTIICT